MMALHSTLLVCLIAPGIYFLRLLYNRLTRPPLPPGPPGGLVFGNVGDFPQNGSKAWLHWHKHKELYGPISSVTTLNQTIVILKDYDVVNDLLEKRSNLYSSRPSDVLIKELIGWDRLLVNQGDMREAREKRKLISGLIGSKKTVQSMRAVHELEVRRFLWRALQKPEDLIDHIRREAGAVILKMVYGYVVAPEGRDSFVEIAELSTSQFNTAIQPGRWLVDTIPILKHLPSWFPGAGFQRVAKDCRRVLDMMAEKPYVFALNHRTRGSQESSYISRLWDSYGPELSAHDEHLIKWASTDIYAGGADTTVSAISVFFLVMALHPEVQQKAQAELDRVVGSRFPTLEDRDHLPYLEALLQEVLRWHPVAPMAVPHRAIKEDTYNGYRIPKDAILIPNIWSFTHDPKTYHDPMCFNPERFLPHQGRLPELDPRRLVFGFGRRTCPGRFHADQNLYLMISNSLAVLQITKAVREDGREVEPVVDFQPGVISHPVPYEVQVRPRSSEREAWIRSIDEHDIQYQGDSQELDELKV